MLDFQLPTDIMLSQKIIDLPPRHLYKRLTREQQASFLINKHFWTEVYTALTRYHCGQPAFPRDMHKGTRELLSVHLDFVLTMYKPINLGWYELCEFMPELELRSPGWLYLELLQDWAKFGLSPSLENQSFSPQGIHRKIRRMQSGEEIRPTFNDLGQWGQYCLGSYKAFFLILEKSKDSTVQKAVRENLKAKQAKSVLILKLTHPSKRTVGYQWVDGNRMPNQKHRRNRNNQPLD
jgi:hypothetical protein